MILKVANFQHFFFFRGFLTNQIFSLGIICIKKKLSTVILFMYYIDVIKFYL
jgi:hypothetical protein